MSAYLRLDFDPGISVAAVHAASEFGRSIDLRIQGSEGCLSCSSYIRNGSNGQQYLRKDGIWKVFTPEDRRICDSGQRETWDGFYGNNQKAVTAFLIWCINNKKIGAL